MHTTPQSGNGNLRKTIMSRVRIDRGSERVTEREGESERECSGVRCVCVCVRASHKALQRQRQQAAAAAAEATAAAGATAAAVCARAMMTPQDRQRPRILGRSRGGKILTGRAPHQWRAAGADGCRRLPPRQGVARARNTRGGGGGGGRSRRPPPPPSPQCPARRQLP